VDSLSNDGTQIESHQRRVLAKYSEKKKYSGMKLAGHADDVSWQSRVDSCYFAINWNQWPAT